MPSCWRCGQALTPEAPEAICPECGFVVTDEPVPFAPGVPIRALAMLVGAVGVLMIAVLFATALAGSTRLAEEIARFGGWAALVVAPLALLNAAAIGWIIGPPRRSAAIRAGDPLVLAAVGTIIILLPLVLIGDSMPEPLQRFFGIGLLEALPLGVMTLVAHRERMPARGLGALRIERALTQAMWIGGFSAIMFLLAGLVGVYIPDPTRDPKAGLLTALFGLGTLGGIIALVILTHQSLHLAGALFRWSRLTECSD